MFTIDVEEYFCVSAFENAISPSSWLSYPSRVEENVEYLLEAMRCNNATGTFFVLGWLAERKPGLVKKIASAGHEVASHGYSHRRIYDMTREEFSEDVRRSKIILEQILGVAVKGYRAPSFSVTRETLWSLEILEELGFLYDSSIYPVYRGGYGIPGGERKIGNILLGNGRSFLEVPLPCVGPPWGRVPVGGGAYLRWFPFWFTKWALSRMNETENIPFVVYVHPWEFDLDHPMVGNIGWFTRQRHYRGIAGNRDKSDYLLRNYSFVSIIENINDRYPDAASPVPSE